jgi:UDP-N-acetylglucosamine 2-epimerase (non-hydrolysing)
VRLVGASADRIVREVSQLLVDPAAYAAMALTTHPHGDGGAAPRIVERVRNFLLTPS